MAKILYENHIILYLEDNGLLPKKTVHTDTNNFNNNFFFISNTNHCIW